MGGKQNAPLQLDAREQAQVEHAKAYACDFAGAGVPGHGQFLLIAKLAALVEDAVSRWGYAPDKEPTVKVQKVAWSGPQPGGCWRDLETGVRVEL